MLHPHTELRFVSPLIGHGVFATRTIPRGTVIWVRDALDRRLSAAEAAGLPTLLRESAEKYCYRDADHAYVLCWDHTRFMNHSFDPNCIPLPFGLELAVRDIAAGEELCNDYGIFNLIESFTPAEAAADRERVQADDPVREAAGWESLLAAALPALPQVDQPLRPLISDAQWETCLEIACGKRPLPSLRDGLRPWSCPQEFIEIQD